MHNSRCNCQLQVVPRVNGKREYNQGEECATLENEGERERSLYSERWFMDNISIRVKTVETFSRGIAHQCFGSRLNDAGPCHGTVVEERVSCVPAWVSCTSKERCVQCSPQSIAQRDNNTMIYGPAIIVPSLSMCSSSSTRSCMQ